LIILGRSMLSMMVAVHLKNSPLLRTFNYFMSSKTRKKMTKKIMSTVVKKTMRKTKRSKKSSKTSRTTQMMKMFMVETRSKRQRTMMKKGRTRSSGLMRTLMGLRSGSRGTGLRDNPQSIADSSRDKSEH
jgi:hypothetical protein